jgi:hypothetical protein
MSELYKTNIKKTVILQTDELGNKLEEPKSYDYLIDVGILKGNTNKVIINYPGAGGTLEGYEDKYLKLAYLMQERIGSVVLMNNVRVPTSEYHNILRTNLEDVIDYCIANSVSLFGVSDPEIYLMGFSNGAGAVAAVAHKYTQISKILLLAPAFGAGVKEVSEGLSEFKNEVYIAIGKNDINVGYKSGETFKGLAKSASLVELVVIPDCDHQFRGETNGRILSKAPLWAFVGDKTFPSPDGGLKLYD